MSKLEFSLVRIINIACKSQYIYQNSKLLVSLVYVVVHQSSLVSFLAGLGQKSSVLRMLLCQNGPQIDRFGDGKVDKRRKEPTVLIYLLCMV